MIGSTSSSNKDQQIRLNNYTLFYELLVVITVDNELVKLQCVGYPRRVSHAVVVLCLMLCRPVVLSFGQAAPRDSAQKLLP